MRLAVLLMMLAACGDSHRIVIDLRTDFAPVYEAVAASASTSDGQQTGRLIEPRDSLFEPAFRIGELEVEDGSHEVEVSLRTATAILRRRFVVAVDAADVGVTVSFTRQCESISCPGEGDDPTATACLAGVCVPEECIEGTEEVCGELALCQRDDECPSSTVACASPRCSEGICGFALDDSECDSSEYCSTQGCIRAPQESLVDSGVDGGPPDGGPVDVAPDVNVDSGSDALMPPVDGVLMAGVADGAVCALMGDGRIWCQGGDELIIGWSGEPISIWLPDIDDAEHLGVGARHACLVRQSGQVRCWGRNGAGEAGGDSLDRRHAARSFSSAHPGGGAMTQLRALLAVALSVVGCSDPRHQLHVDVRTDLVAGYEALALSIRVESQEVVMALDQGTELLDPPLRAATFELEEGVYKVEVEMRTLGSSLKRRVVVSLRDEDTVATVTLTRSCVGVSCSEELADMSCLGGTCVADACVTGAESSCQGLELCTRDEDCPSGNECASPACVDGLCVLNTDDSTCGDMQFCASIDGCKDIPVTMPPDAGVEADSAMDGGADADPVDSGPADAGADATAQDAGPLTPTTGFEHSSSGRDQSCAVRAGQIWCFGTEAIGDGMSLDGPRIAQVQDIDDAVDVECGSTFCCAQRSNAVSCWGSNAVGQLGLESVPLPFNYRVDVEGLGRVDLIGLGTEHGCALTAGTVSCWGSNDFGETGRPPSSMVQPLAITLPMDAIDIAAGVNHSCAALVDGTTWCWGDNQRGMLGVPASTTSSVSPVQAVGIVGVVEIDLSHECTMALTDDGDIYEWTCDVGDGLNLDAKAIGPATSIAAGAAHQCAIIDQDTYCWGSDFFGQLAGLGSSVTPVRMPSLPPATEIDAGERMTCAVTVDTELWCWGYDLEGQATGTGATETVAPTRLELPL